jgi:transcriptional regulator with XRE-family HTH domain
MVLNERLRLLIEKINISQRQFAAKIELDPGYLTRILQGKSVPPDRILLLIESVFNVNRQWLDSGEGAVFKDEGITYAKKQLLDAIDTLDDDQIHAVSSFLEYLAAKK